MKILRRVMPAMLATTTLLLAGCATVGPVDSPGQRYWDVLKPDTEGDTVPPIEARLSQLWAAPLTEASCSEHRAGLEHALGRVPIDLVGVRTARDCASLLGDVDWQVRMQAQLDALIEYAFRDQRGLSADAPAVILYPPDIEVLTEARGLEILWVRYVGLSAARHLLVEASVQGAGRGQHRYYFDLLDAMVRFNSNEPIVDYPSGRRLLAISRMESDALEGDALALTGHLYMNVETGAVSVDTALRALADAGDLGVIGAVVSWVEVCLGTTETSDAEPLCADAEIEQAIATLRDQNIAEAWALDAVYRIVRHGATVDDPELRQALADAAARSSQERMWMYAAAVLLDRGSSGDPDADAAIDRALGRMLQRAAEAGSADAHIQRVVRLPAEQRRADNPFVMRSLRAAAEQGNARAHMMLAALTGLDSEAGFDHVFQAFRGGLPEAQLLLALSTDSAPARLALLRRAAFGGNGPANVLLAQQALMRDRNASDPEAAMNWLASGAGFGHVESAARLAALLWLHPELDPGSVDPGLDAVHQLDADAGREAAMRVPQVLLGIEPFNGKPSAGIRLLERLSADGIGEATLMLADRHRHGDGVETDLQAAAQAYLLAEQQGAAEALFEHAGMVVFDLDQPERALPMFERAARAGHENAANDLAWFLCTGQAGAEMDPLRGLSEVEALIARFDTPHPYFFSTLAACQAALGEFAHARASQRIALRRALKELPEETDVHEQMGQRLALYEADQAYVWVP